MMSNRLQLDILSQLFDSIHLQLFAMTTSNSLSAWIAVIKKGRKKCNVLKVIFLSPAWTDT